MAISGQFVGSTVQVRCELMNRRRGKDQLKVITATGRIAAGRRAVSTCRQGGAVPFGQTSSVVGLHPGVMVGATLVQHDKVPAGTGGKRIDLPSVVGTLPTDRYADRLVVAVYATLHLLKLSGAGVKKNFNPFIGQHVTLKADRRNQPVTVESQTRYGRAGNGPKSGYPCAVPDNFAIISANTSGGRADTCTSEYNH